MRNRRAILAVLTAAACVAAATVTACSLLEDYDGLEGSGNDAAVTPDTTPPLVDAAVEAAPIDPCLGDGVPPSFDGGTQATDAAADLPALVSAVTAVQFVGTKGNAGLAAAGRNIDFTCGFSCLSSAATPPKDPPATGVDNAAFELFSALRAVGIPLDDQGFDEGIKRGLWTFVFRLSRWSGEPNDSDVQLDAFNGTSLDNAGSDAGAQFDGTDVWATDSASSSAGVPLFRSMVGYVRNGVLVARFARLIPKLRFYANGFVLLTDVEMYSVSVVANITRDGAGYKLTDAKVAGVTTPEQILAQLQRAGTCGSDPIFATVQDYVCENRDLPGTLGAPATAKCEAISIGLRFEARAAKLSSKVDTITDTVYCDGGIDPTKGCGTR